MRKQHHLIFFISLLFMTSCFAGGQTVRGNGQVISVHRSVGDYSGVIVAGSMHVFVKQGPVKDIKIEAESNLIPYIETRPDDGEIEISLKKNVRVVTHEPIDIYLTAPDIRHLSMSGSGNIRVQDSLINEDEMKLNLTGSGDIQLQVNTPEVDAHITGSGNILVSGETKNIDLDILGSGDFKGSDLKSEQASIKIAGSGNAHIFSSIRLEAKILGSGNIYYHGDPSVETQSTGSGKVIKEN